jgi:alkylhydroperoxidase family enzyme
MSDRIKRMSFDQLAPAVQQVLEMRVKRLGYLGEFFKCAGHQPDILVPFMEMTEALKHALPDRLTEVGALTVAKVMGNDYERHQHERLSRKLGFGEAWVAAVERLEPDAVEGLSDAERAVQRLVIAAIKRRGHGVAAQLDELIDLIGSEQAIAVLFLIGRYLTHAVIVNALALAPPVPSIFEEKKSDE